jgi:hypothetical protein
MVFILVVVWLGGWNWFLMGGKGEKFEKFALLAHVACAVFFFGTAIEDGGDGYEIRHGARKGDGANDLKVGVR